MYKSELSDSVHYSGKWTEYKSINANKTKYRICESLLIS